MATITISLKDVVIGGVFGPIHLGMSRAQVHEILDDPDDWSTRDAAKKGSDPWRTSAIWKYGDIEFHFLLQNDCLGLICTDDFNVPTGGKSIALDPWIIRRDVSQDEIERALRTAHIDFRRIESRFDEDVTGLAVGKRVRLWFGSVEPNEPQVLIAFECADPSLPSVEKV